jgi:hypothetical protein
MPAAEVLAPYATRFRYPGAFSGPSAEEVVEALRLAREVLAFVRARLPGYQP